MAAACNTGTNSTQVTIAHALQGGEEYDIIIHESCLEYVNSQIDLVPDCTNSFWISNAAG